MRPAIQSIEHPFRRIRCKIHRHVWARLWTTKHLVPSLVVNDEDRTNQDRTKTKLRSCPGPPNLVPISVLQGIARVEDEWSVPTRLDGRPAAPHLG